MAYAKPNRDFYIPKGATKIAPKSGGVVFYLFESSKGAPCAMCFIGRAQKPSWNFRFLDAAAREKRIRNQIEGVAARAKDKAERKAEANRPHNLEKGLILYTCWGYDQTNTEFYEIIDVPSPCYVVLQEIGSPLVRGEESFMSGNSVPDPETRIGKPFRRKVNMGGNRPSVSICKVVTAWVWDGKEKATSWYA